MTNYVDIAIGVIFLYLMIEGWWKGLVRSLIGIVGYVAAFFVAKFYYADMAELLMSRFEWFRDLKDNIAASIMSSFSENVQLQEILSGTTQADLRTTLGNQAVVEGLKLPQSMMNQVANFAEKVDLSAARYGAVEGFAQAVANGIVYGFSFLLVALLVLLAVKLIGLILDGATEVPIIKQVNKLGGLIFGIIKAGIFVFLIMATVAFLSPLAPEMKLVEAIQASYVGAYFYNNNILLILLDIFLS